MKDLRRRRGSAPPRRPRAADSAKPPSLHELDAFSLADIQRWQWASSKFDELHRELHFGLETQRLARRNDILEALRSRAAPPVRLERWYRAVEYQYCLEPLSAAGSVIGYGGRFNMGREIGEGAFPVFPSLYVAEDLETAFREFHQIDSAPTATGLTGEDLALRKPGGFLTAEVTGSLNFVFDVGDLAALRPVAAIFSSFTMPPRAGRLIRELGLQQVGLAKTPDVLKKTLLARDWRAWPVQLDVPANSQVFGRLLANAGFEAVLYPSTRNGHRCAAIFTDNLHDAHTYIELVGATPPDLKARRLGGMEA